ncbi:MAG TPA: PDZ domain-containing protein [Pyrinomonadaceae bacterium]|nr:PDZ domain-containing protein [Pyrinomonadaceae bacterium]
MRQTRAHSLALAASVLLFFSLASTHAAEGARAARQREAAAAPRTAPDISYTVSMPRPNTHLLEVEARLAYRQGAPASVDLVMPVWTPGSYLVREYARHVQDFAVTAGTAGHALDWAKVNKNTWRVETGGARELRVTYKVYSNELTVRTSELNDRHAFWNNTALLVYPEGHLRAPSTVRVVPFGNWKVATGLPPVAGQPNTFRAEDFDVLYDAPFLVSNFRVLDFEVKGIPHRIVIDGEGNFDPERMRADIRRVVEATLELMREIPYRDYTFILMTHPTVRGGLEHLNSTALIWRRFNFRPDAEWRDFLSLVAHEYFHLWNVKRIRPDALGPFDYTQENYTRLLWVAEGTTSYYDNLLVRRAGLMTDRQYLDIIAKAVEDLRRTPGRLKQSIEEASFDAWIEYYRPDENTVNTAVSYYDKGALVALLLDLEIRRHSDGRRSLDDVMRALYDEFYKKGRNYAPADFQRAAEQAAGASLDEFFRRYVRGREELEWDAALERVGLRLDTTGEAAAGRPAGERANLGANLAQEGERLRVTNVPSDTAAYEAGLYANDQIVAVDGFRATRDFLNARLEEKRPGDVMTLTVFRNEELRTVNVRLAGRSEGAYRIVPVRNPSDAQRRAYQAWLGAPFPRAAQGQ